MNSNDATVKQLLADQATTNRIIDLQLMLAEKHDQLNKATHDLRNPLSAINLNLRLLSVSTEAGQTDRSQELFERLTKNTTSLKLLIDALYETNTASDEGLVLSMEPVDINQLVAEATQRCAPYAESRAIPLNAHQSSEPAIACADPSMLLCSIENLLGNAIRVSSSGQPISLVVRTNETAIFLDVSDSGRGLSQAKLEQVFGRNEPGSGLYIAHQLVKAMGGEISAESPGKDRGTTFSISLKRAS